MAEWTLTIDPWNIRAADLANGMNNIENRFKGRWGFPCYPAGTDGDRHSIYLEYVRGGELILHIIGISDEAIPSILAILSPYDIRIVEVFLDGDLVRSFDPCDADDYRPFQMIVQNARQRFIRGFNPVYHVTEQEAFKQAWEDFKAWLKPDIEKSRGSSDD